MRDASLMKALGLKYPLVVAPMAGGPSTAALAASASESGALGSVGAAYLTPERIEEIALQIRSKTLKPIAINLFIPTQSPTVSREQLDRAIERTQKFRTELALPAPNMDPPYEEDFSRQFEAVLRVKPRVFSFVFGVLPGDYMKEAHERGIFVIGSATSADEALELQESGVDAIVVQGIEAGGHRSIFDAAAQDPEIKTLDLLREVKARVKLPLIAAGGIMNGADVKAMLKAGAEAVQMGTAFLATKEAGTSIPYRQKLLESPNRETKTTRAFSGRLARGMINRFMKEMDAQPEVILPFPVQNKFTRDLRNAAVAAGTPEFLSLWSGSGAGELWTGSAADLIQRLFS